MNDIAEERPDFFEGEYLGADDLQQLIVYMRNQSARHALGSHAWGIASGLDLVEQPAPSGTGVDVYLLPGYAVDGYGRGVVVINPLRLTVDLFTGIPSGAVPLWLRYDQGGSKGVRPGFEVCASEDAYSRVAESYALEAGVLELAKRQSGISVAGVAVPDAREALRVFDDNAPIMCDASVPFQDLPLGDEKQRWLIPLGLVGWKAGSPGTLLALTDDDRLRSRRARRYVGVVAESVLAADGLIRLRNRTTPSKPGVLTDDLCGADDVADAAHDQDVQLCDSRPEFNELVWIEGRLRVTDDARLLGARLEFRDSGGTNYLPANQPGSPPLFFERTDNKNNADLKLMLGTAKTGHNNFIIADAGQPTVHKDTSGVPQPCAKLDFAPTPRVIVQDDGKVAIGPAPPDELLMVEGTDHAFVHVKTTSTPHDLYAGVTGDGAILAALNNDELLIRTGGTDPKDDAFTRIAVDHKGHVGIGTTTPDQARLVTLEAPDASYLIARTKNGPHEVLLGADTAGASVSANTGGDDLVLAANGGVPYVWIKADGKVGVGTGSPGRDVTVQGRQPAAYLNVRTSDNREILIGADGSGTMISAMSDDDLHLRAGSNQNGMILKAGSLNVGVGTDAPLEKLDVRGNIKLGGFGDLFALGSPDNLRVIVGNVDAAGNRISGSGFLSFWIGQGEYRILVFPPFAAPPVVMANVTASADDDFASLANVNAAFFDIHIYDTSLTHREENPFSFVAFGQR